MTDIELLQSVKLKLSAIEPNKGQIEGLPKNPRFIKDEKFKKLVKSIEEHPDMMAMRELLVYPLDNGKHIIIGGNMRYRAMKELGIKEAPCKVIPQDTTIEQLQAYTLKDNSGYGEWDFVLLSKEWDLSLLDSCAIELPEIVFDESSLLIDNSLKEHNHITDHNIDKSDVASRLLAKKGYKVYLDSEKSTIKFETKRDGRIYELPMDMKTIGEAGKNTIKRAIENVSKQDAKVAILYQNTSKMDKQYVLSQIELFKTKSPQRARDKIEWVIVVGSNGNVHRHKMK